MTYTFAYGMNMDPAGMPVGSVGRKAWLRDWQLGWRGFADVQPSPGAVVPGVLWQLPNDRALAMLDAREGVPSLYRRVLATVEVDGGPPQQAWVYTMTAETLRWVREEGQHTCSDHYLDWVRAGRETFGHPTDDLQINT